MIAYEELDVLHDGSVQISMLYAKALFTTTCREAIDLYGVSLQQQMVHYASKLHTLLLQEGFHSTYSPAPYGDKETINVYLGNNLSGFMGYHHTIVIAVHPRHHTLIYYNGPPYMGTTQELIHRLRDAHGRELAKERCASCHYINTELWVCGMGRVLDVECREYMNRIQL
jgi:hypothetical protein